jgi:hypothetical protein
VSDAIGGSAQIELACRQEEQNAKKTVPSASIPSKTLSYCDQVAFAIGGSYQILLACVQEENKARRQLLDD